MNELFAVKPVIIQMVVPIPVNSIEPPIGFRNFCFNRHKAETLIFLQVIMKLCIGPNRIILTAHQHNIIITGAGKYLFHS